jgi:hypothetical protein
MYGNTDRSGLIFFELAQLASKPTAQLAPQNRLSSLAAERTETQLVPHLAAHSDQLQHVLSCTLCGQLHSWL